MGVTNLHSALELTVARELCAAMHGRVVSRSDDDYVQTRQIWNGAVQHQPALFAVCETSADVQAAVRSARQHNLPLSVRGGGHDWAGRALRDGGLVAGGQQKSSPFSVIILQDFRGVPTRVPLTATAFGLRKEHFMVEIIAAWEPTAEDDGQNHREWSRTISDNLAPHALPGGYPNMLGPDDYEQTAHAYAANTGRLQQLKRLFDPDSVFTSAISLPLQKAA